MPTEEKMVDLDTSGEGAEIKLEEQKDESVVETEAPKQEETKQEEIKEEPKEELSEGSELGNFVEANRSNIGKKSKAKHLTYLGDATLGQKVNVGAGTITCNYDGKNKHKTLIEDGSFIGSNSSLVAPLTLGEGSYTGAGSVITKNVPKGKLAVGRGKQVNLDKKK